MKVAYINKDKELIEQMAKDITKKIMDRERKKAYKMFLKKQGKNTKKTKP